MRRRTKWEPTYISTNRSYGLEVFILYFYPYNLSWFNNKDMENFASIVAKVMAPDLFSFILFYFAKMPTREYLGFDAGKTNLVVVARQSTSFLLNSAS